MNSTPDAPVIAGWSCLECGQPTDETSDICRDCLLDGQDPGRMLDFDSPAPRKGFTVVPNTLLMADDISFQAKFMLITLMRYAWGRSDPYPGQQRLMADMGISERSVREYSAELVENGYLRKIRRGQGATTVYRISWSKLESMGLRPAKSAGLDRQNLPVKKDSVEERLNDVCRESASALSVSAPPQESLLGNDHEAVMLAWLAEDALISHRPNYFERRDVADEISRALRRHGREGVIAAIKNYATVLGSDDHMWNHSWPCKEFLRRGLDRFVDESEPLRQYARFATGVGKVGLSAEAILAMRDHAA